MPDRQARIEIVPAELTIGATTRTARPDEEHYLRLRDANGEVLVTSELYDSKSNARRAVRSFLDAVQEINDALDADAAAEVVVEVDRP